MPPGHSGFARRDGAVTVHDRQAVELLASALARLEAVTAWLDTRPPVDEKERPVAGRGRGALAPTDLTSSTAASMRGSCPCSAPRRRTDNGNDHCSRPT